MVSSIMAKLYSTTMERNIGSWVEHHHKRMLDKASFISKHSIIDHLVTLRVIMEENFKRKTICCCFANYQNIFSPMPRSEVSKKMRDIIISLEYRSVVAQLYEQFRCQLNMGQWFHKVLFKQHGDHARGYTLSYVLWFMHDKLEETTKNVGKE